MKIHEYQAKEILRRYGIPVQPGRVATTPAEAEAAAREFGVPVVVKAQVYVGGRGKAGGVKFGQTPEQTREVASAILGMDIKGLTVQKVLITPAIDIAEEYYVGIVLDRASQAPVVMVSAADPRRARPRLHRIRRHPGRDQPPRAHQGRPSARRRRQAPD